jgi:flagellar hook-associated protein 3 FlgL
MTRVVNLAQHTLILSQIRDAQARMQETQIQMATGYKAQRYSGIAPDARQLVNLESSHTRMEQYQASNKVVDLRLQTMESSTAQVLDAATKLKTLLTNALNASNANDMAIGLQAQNLLNEVAKQLNVKIGDRYLFSGSKTDTPPVNLSAPGYSAPPTTYPSVADTGYYQGDGVVLSTRAADDYDLNYGVTADEPAFEKTIRALQLAATVTTSPTLDRDRLNDALGLVNDAINGLPTIRSRIGAAQNALDSANEDHADMMTYMEQSIVQITSVDVTEAASRMASDQLMLQASYMTISQLSQLSLANYLR